MEKIRIAKSKESNQVLPGRNVRLLGMITNCIEDERLKFNIKNEKNSLFSLKV
jgi:hypothetical protein